MLPREQLYEAAMQLHASRQLAGSDQQVRLDQAASFAYWQQLATGLPLDQETNSATAQVSTISDDELQKISRRFDVDGYFQTAPLLSTESLEFLRKRIETVRANGWPAVFAFVYDEFWLAVRSVPVMQAARTLLGHGVRQLPHIWAHYVRPQRGAAGWAPHADGFDRPGRITGWLALTDATIDNGCMFVIPRCSVPPQVGTSVEECANIRWKDASLLLQNCRPLPAAAGSLLGWGLDVIHWGSACQNTKQTRISISFGFVSEAARLEPDELPLLEQAPDCLPTFEQKLSMICQAILTYNRFDTEALRFSDLAAVLQKRLSSC